MTQEEFKQRIYETIKDRVFFSNFNGKMAEVINELPD